MKTFLTVALIFVCLALSCKKEPELDIVGFTSTDHLGNVIGTPDASDWIFDASWTNKELNIFSDIESGDLSDDSTGTIVMQPGFPNPVTDASISLSLNTTTACKMRYAFVNKDRQKIRYGVAALQPGDTTLSIPTGSGLPSELYRLYYVFDAEGNYGFLKGHGDVFVP